MIWIQLKKLLRNNSLPYLAFCISRSVSRVFSASVRDASGLRISQVLTGVACKPLAASAGELNVSRKMRVIKGLIKFSPRQG